MQLFSERSTAVQVNLFCQTLFLPNMNDNLKDYLAQKKKSISVFTFNYKNITFFSYFQKFIQEKCENFEVFFCQFFFSLFPR